MNCKKGDLAIVVRSHDGINLGRPVRCIRLIGEHRGWSNVWETDIELTWRKGRRFELDRAAPDECLRPIRGDLLDDEIESMKELIA